MVFQESTNSNHLVWNFKLIFLDIVCFFTVSLHFAQIFHPVLSESREGEAAALLPPRLLRLWYAGWS